jgi:predicted metal-dependent hydrolase
MRRDTQSISQILVDDLKVEVTRKSIKNVYLRVTRPEARLRMSVPARMPLADIECFIRSHREWIDRRCADIASLPRAQPQNYASGELVPLFGIPHRLVLSHSPGKASARVESDRTILLMVPNGADREGRERAMHSFYREQLREKVSALIAAWEPLLSVSVAEWGIRRMRTRWGSCNIRARRIWLGLELATQPESCLEYVVVHEMNHLIERGHTRRFHALMDGWLPDWRERRALLNPAEYAAWPDESPQPR